MVRQAHHEVKRFDNTRPHPEPVEGWSQDFMMLFSNRWRLARQRRSPQAMAEAHQLDTAAPAKTAASNTKPDKKAPKPANQ